jgi:hypothetical protein
VLRLGIGELLLLLALAAMFLLPLLALVVYVLARGRKRPER